MENNTNNKEIPTAITREHLEVIDLHTFACSDDETLLGLTDAEGREFVIHLTNYIKGL